jgi:hypothetical protein
MSSEKISAENDASTGAVCDDTINGPSREERSEIKMTKSIMEKVLARFDADTRESSSSEEISSEKTSSSSEETSSSIDAKEEKDILWSDDSQEEIGPSSIVDESSEKQEEENSSSDDDRDEYQRNLGRLRALAGIKFIARCSTWRGRDNLGWYTTAPPYDFVRKGICEESQRVKGVVLEPAARTIPLEPLRPFSSVRDFIKNQIPTKSTSPSAKPIEMTTHCASYESWKARKAQWKEEDRSEKQKKRTEKEERRAARQYRRDCHRRAKEQFIFIYDQKERRAELEEFLQTNRFIGPKRPKIRFLPPLPHVSRHPQCNEKAKQQHLAFNQNAALLLKLGWSTWELQNNVSVREDNNARRFVDQINEPHAGVSGIDMSSDPLFVLADIAHGAVRSLDSRVNEDNTTNDDPSPGHIEKNTSHTNSETTGSGEIDIASSKSHDVTEDTTNMELPTSSGAGIASSDGETTVAENTNKEVHSDAVEQPTNTEDTNKEVVIPYIADVQTTETENSLNDCRADEPRDETAIAGGNSSDTGESDGLMNAQGESPLASDKTTNAFETTTQATSISFEPVSSDSDPLSPGIKHPSCSTKRPLASPAVATPPSVKRGTKRKCPSSSTKRTTSKEAIEEGSQMSSDSDPLPPGKKRRSSLTTSPSARPAIATPPSMKRGTKQKCPSSSTKRTTSKKVIKKASQMMRKPIKLPMARNPKAIVAETVAAPRLSKDSSSTNAGGESSMETEEIPDKDPKGFPYFVLQKNAKGRNWDHMRLKAGKKKLSKSEEAKGWQAKHASAFFCFLCHFEGKYIPGNATLMSRHFNSEEHQRRLKELSEK